MTLQRVVAIVIRPLLIATMLVALVLGLMTLTAQHWRAEFFGVVLGASVWGYPVLMFGDMWAAYTGKISEYHRRFYGEVARDLWIAGASGAVIMLLYLLSSARYEAFSFDIVSASVPFLVVGIHTIVHITRMQLAKRSIKRAVKWVMFFYIAIISVVAFYVSVHIASGAYTLLSSTWLQLTLFCASLFIFVESRRTQFVLEQAELQPSPTFLAVFGKLGLYELVAQHASEWNRAVAVELQEANIARNGATANDRVSDDWVVNLPKQPPPLPHMSESASDDP